MCNVNGILLGDFNLNFAKKLDINYSHVRYFDDFELILYDKNLIQLIEFPTWSRIVNNVLLESILDHIYVKDPTLVSGIQSTKPLFGDHLLVSITVRLEKGEPEISMRRDWRKYSKELLLGELSLVDWSSDVDNVQNIWDELESKLVRIVDKITPLTEFTNSKVKTKLPNSIMQKKKKKRLLKQIKKYPTNEIKQKLNSLNCEIKTFYFSQRREAVRKGIVPGNSRSLWSAVNMSKDIGPNEIPSNMYHKDMRVPDSEVANCVAIFFDEKVAKIVKSANIDPMVYNGQKKLDATNSNFMSEMIYLNVSNN